VGDPTPSELDAGHRLFDGGDRLRDGFGQHLPAGGRDQDVVLDADATYVSELFQPATIEAVARDASERGVAQDRRVDVEARLDRHRHAGGQISIQAQRAQAEDLGALAAGGVAGAVAQVFHVVDVQAQQVSDAVPAASAWQAST